MTLAAIHREIHRMDPKLDKADKAFQAATVLLAACHNENIESMTDPRIHAAAAALGRLGGKAKRIPKPRPIGTERARAMAHARWRKWRENQKPTPL